MPAQCLPDPADTSGEIDGHDATIAMLLPTASGRAGPKYLGLAAAPAKDVRIRRDIATRSFRSRRTIGL